MSSKINILAFAIATLTAGAVATHDTCAASCIQTVTATIYSTALCVSSESTYFETSTRGGIYTNATSTESSTPYTSVIYPNITSSASVSEATYSSYPYFNSTVAGSSTAPYLNTSSTTAPYLNVSSTTYTATSSETFSSGNATKTHKPQQTSSPTLDCQHNNCLRQFLRHPQVTAFCATYTTTINTATTDLPSYVSQCHADPSRISSACSCVVTATPDSTTSTTSPLETETSGGVYVTGTYDPATLSASATDCASASVVFETITTTTTVSITTTVPADPATTSACEDGESTSCEAATSTSSSAVEVTSTDEVASSSSAGFRSYRGR